MNKLFNTKNIFRLLALLFITVTVISCQRDGSVAEDDLPQEELTNIILLVKEDTPGSTAIEYNYSIGAGGIPNIPLKDGKSYTVEAKFRNGNEDATGEIIDAKNEHFLIFDFPKSKINITRLDGNDLRNDGKRVGLKTKWDVVQAVDGTSPFLKLTLIHSPESVNDAKAGTAWGSVVGGETDAEATYNLSN
ncbi:hypothetical protein BN1195_03475 [Chryseobacterium oranimense G311]|uniref:hypothetical protein n=1 Tax=Chryseobacterium oranimense TaxID=421058 RepID=UPI0005337F40|nr:hypothetical protein [Chryseobacterium oranimense]CEJ71132.1 hypothetical protein BN1195_03475 [Chryseobacterium oranimense G311]